MPEYKAGDVVWVPVGMYHGKKELCNDHTLIYKYNLGDEQFTIVSARSSDVTVKIPSWKEYKAWSERELHWYVSKKVLDANPKNQIGYKSFCEYCSS